MTPSDEELVAEARNYARGYRMGLRGLNGQVSVLLDRLADRLSALSRPGLDRATVVSIIRGAFSGPDGTQNAVDQIIALTTSGERTSGGEVSSSTDHDPVVGVALDQVNRRKIREAAELALSDRIESIMREWRTDRIIHNNEVARLMFAWGESWARCTGGVMLPESPLSSAKPADRDRSRDDIETSVRQEQSASDPGLSEQSREGGARAEEIAPTNPAFDAWVRRQITGPNGELLADEYAGFIRREFEQLKTL